MPQVMRRHSLAQGQGEKHPEALQSWADRGPGLHQSRASAHGDASIGRNCARIPSSARPECDDGALAIFRRQICSRTTPTAGAGRRYEVKRRC
jgi:hypothetical protein